MEDLRIILTFLCYYFSMLGVFLFVLCFAGDFMDWIDNLWGPDHE